MVCKYLVLILLIYNALELYEYYLVSNLEMIHHSINSLGCGHHLVICQPHRDFSSSAWAGNYVLKYLRMEIIFSYIITGNVQLY